MKILLSIFTFTLVFSFTQAQMRPVTSSLNDIKPVERPVVKGEDFLKGLQLLSEDNRGEIKEARELFKVERNTIPGDLTKEDRMEFRKDRMEHRNDLKQYIKEKKETFKESRQQLVGEPRERVNKLLLGMTSKFIDALATLDEAEGRLNSLVNENKIVGIEESLSNAVNLKSVAKDSVDEVMKNLVEEVSNEEGISKEIIRELVNIAQSDIKNAWYAFREVITEVKSLQLDSVE